MTRTFVIAALLLGTSFAIASEATQTSVMTYDSRTRPTHNLVVRNDAGGKVVIKNVPGAAQPRAFLTPLEVNAVLVGAQLAGWSISDQATLASALPAATASCLTTYIDEAGEVSCFAMCFDCQDVIIIPTRSTGHATISFSSSRP